MAITPAFRRVLAASAGGVLLLAVLAACGGDDSSDATADNGSTTTQAVSDPYGNSAGTTTTTTAAAGAATDGQAEGEEGATIIAKDFSLTSVSAAPGADVSFQNQGAVTHTLTADKGEFDTGHVGSGETSSITAPTSPGTYEYHCAIHTSMKGTLTVTG